MTKSHFQVLGRGEGWEGVRVEEGLQGREFVEKSRRVGVSVG